GRPARGRRGSRRRRGCRLRLRSGSAWARREFNRLTAALAGEPLAVGQPEKRFDELLEALERSSAALRAAGVLFVPGGGVAAGAGGRARDEAASPQGALAR